MSPDGGQMTVISLGLIASVLDAAPDNGAPVTAATGQVLTLRAAQIL